MEKVFKALDELKEINSAYDISGETISGLQNEMTEARVCLPIIGKFSTGKSALVNTLLGYSKPLLKEEITPETAVPTEILYTDEEDFAEILYNNGSVKPLTLDEYKEFIGDSSSVTCVRLHLRNTFLETIRDVMLVDMPGFESDSEFHNKAIDCYLPKSLAYIIAIPADDMIVRGSIGRILKELFNEKMPLCLAITKYDKRTDDFESSFNYLKDSLKKIVDDKEIKYCITSSETGETVDLKNFLNEIQLQSQTILANKYKPMALNHVENTENYLKTALSGSQMSESELNEKEEQLKKKFTDLDNNFLSAQSDFEQETADCIREIKNDVMVALENETSSFVTMLLNNQNINDRLNSIVRDTVKNSVKERFITRMDKYLKKVEISINSDTIGDISVSFSCDKVSIGKGIAAVATAAVAGLFLSGTVIVGAIMAVFAGIAALIKGNAEKEKKRREAEEKLRNEIYPRVIVAVEKEIETAIIKQVKLVNMSIEGELKNQRETLEKALEDVRAKMNDEKSAKESLEANMQKDLERIGEIKNELR